MSLNAIPQPPEQPTARLIDRALDVFPGGITRATVDRDPALFYVREGSGAYLTDVDGRRMLDLNNNFTTLIHGHGYAPVAEAVTKVIRDGTCFSNPTPHEIRLAELICGRIPAAEQIRFVNTGTEAVMFAIKAARVFTGRPAIAKIEGAYHGGYDWAEAGQSGTPANWGDANDPIAVPHYRGQPKSVTDDVVMLRFNDIDGAKRQITANAGRLACILIDPVPSRAGLIVPDAAFLSTVTETAREHGILIVADEVLNLRQGYHGASARFGLDPDLITMGKIIGGGFPIGAIGGKRAVMDVFGSKLSQGGTFSANPVSMVAGYTSMSDMTEETFADLEKMGAAIRQKLRQSIEHHQAQFTVTGSASLFRIHPRSDAPRDYRDAYMAATEQTRMKLLGRFFKARGVLLPYAAAACLSTAMTAEDIDLIASVFDAYLASPEARA